MVRTSILFLAASMLVVRIDSLLLAQVSPNQLIHPNPASFQFEPSIATHPNDPNTVLIAADARNNEISRIGWHYTTNGGLTWVGRDTLPTQSDFTKLMTDASAAIDLDGNLFISGIHKGIFVARSTDSGQNWSHTTVATPTGPERPHMTIDSDPDSPFKNNVYIAYTNVSLTPPPALFSLSTDRGQTFSSPVTISGTLSSAAALGANLAVGPDGVLYATWSGFNTPPFSNPTPFYLGFAMSTDGGASWGGARSLRTITFNGGAHGVSFFNHPSMAVDKSNGERRGWVYITYAERNPSAPDIFLIRSSDHGSSWSDPVRVNQDGNRSKDQWQPWISVDPSTGTVFVVYLDARNFLNNDSAEVYVSYSLDGAQTFKDALVSDVPFRPSAVQLAAPIAPQYMGSYIGISVLHDTIWTAWNDNRSGLFLEGKRLHQVYVSRMTYTPTLGPDGAFSTKDIRFGQVTAGMSKDTTFVITNYGGDTLKVSSITSSTPEFSARPTSFNVPPGKSFVDTLRYTPAVSNTILAKFIVTSNNPSADTISVSGGDPASSVERLSSELPAEFALSQNYPNPFNPSTEIRFTIPCTQFTSLKIYDALGREVFTLVNEELRPGTYSVSWDATGFPSGVYLYRLQAGEFGQTKKLVLLR